MADNSDSSTESWVEGQCLIANFIVLNCKLGAVFDVLNLIITIRLKTCIFSHIFPKYKHPLRKFWKKMSYFRAIVGVFLELFEEMSSNLWLSQIKL